MFGRNELKKKADDGCNRRLVALVTEGEYKAVKKHSFETDMSISNIIRRGLQETLKVKKGAKR